MREILFRGKRIDNGEWVYGDLVQSPAHCIVQIYEQELCGDNFAVDPSTVGQYTGFTDKNGKKIFEGDIIKITAVICDSELVKTVIFNRGLFGVEHSRTAVPLRAWDNEQFEIIGNAIDTPELLKGANNHDD